MIEWTRGLQDRDVDWLAVGGGVLSGSRGRRPSLRVSPEESGVGVPQGALWHPDLVAFVPAALARSHLLHARLTAQPVDGFGDEDTRRFQAALVGIPPGRRAEQPRERRLLRAH